MPPVAAAIAYTAAAITTVIAGATGASLLAAAVINSIITYTLKVLVVIAANAAVQMLVGKPKNQTGNINQGLELKLKLDSSLAREIIVGINATGGSVVWAHTHTPAGSKVPNQCLKRVIALSDYPVDSLVQVKYGLDVLTFSLPLNSGTRAACTSHFQSKAGADCCFVTFYDGTQTTADPTMLAGAPGLWTSDHIGYGVAYAVVEHYYDPDAYSNGEPELTWIIKGAPCYDDRHDGSKPARTGDQRLNDPTTWEWTDNAGVITAQVMRGWRNPHNTDVLIYGVQAQDRDLEDAMLLSAYNTCDQDCDRADASTEHRYRANMILRTNESHATALLDLQAAMDGRIIDRGGAITIRPGANHTPVFHLTDESIVWSEQKSWQPRASLEELTNYVTGTFVDGEGGTYSEKPFPTLSNPSWETDDGGERFITQVAFKAVHSWGQVQRITRRMWLASRQQATIAFVGPISMMEAEQGDWFTMTSERWGFTDKYFEIQQLYITQDLKCALIGREVDPDNDIWEAASDEQPRLDTVWNPTTPDVPVPIFTLTPYTISQGTDTKIPSILFYQEDSILSQETIAIEVQYCLTADVGTGPYSLVPLIPATEGTTILPGNFLPDTSYSVRARNQGSNGRVSDWSAWEDVTTDADFFISLLYGLGDLATEDQVDWASQVTGVSKPENDATKSHVYRQASTPSTGLTVNDIWVKLDGGGSPLEVYAWNGSVWIKGADLTGLNIASGIVSQGALATQNQVVWASQITGSGKPDDFANRCLVYKQASTPTAQSVNDIWVQLDGVGNPIAIYAWNGSSWINGGDRTYLNTAAAITGQGAWATATVPSGLTPTLVNGRTQYMDSAGMLWDYRGILYGYTAYGVAGRTTSPLSAGVGVVYLASHTVKLPTTAGAVDLTCPAATFSGLSNDTDYAVYWRPQYGDTFCTAAVNAPAYRASPDGYFEIGTQRTPTGGGTWTDPATDFTSTGNWDAYNCVHTNAYVATGAESAPMRAGDMNIGDPLVLMDTDGLDNHAGEITNYSIGVAPCWKLMTVHGTLTVSDTTPIMTRDTEGGAPYAISVADLEEGDELPYYFKTSGVVWTPLLAKEYVGDCEVALIYCDEGIYAAADRREGPFMFTHNPYNKIIP